MRPPIPVTTNLDVIVNSFGGVGTSFFMRFLAEHLRINCPHNQDLLKHCIRPPLFPKPGFKAIYIFGNPLDATVSLFNRGYHFKHSERLLANNPELQPITKSTTLESYLDAAVDLFKFDKHYDHWKNLKTPYPILFVKYEALWDQLPAILNFLNLEPGLAKGFPTKRARNSKLTSLPPHRQRQLEALYGEFARFLDSEPDLTIRPGDSSQKIQSLASYPFSIIKNRKDIHFRLMASTFLKPKPSKAKSNKA